MVEHVEAKTVPACREALEKITEDDIYELFKQFMKVEKYGVKKGRLEIVYVHRLNEFTKKRIKLKLKCERRRDEIIVQGEGNINVELIVKCSGENEVAVGLTVYGKAEKYVERKKVEEFVKRLLELVESKAPKAVQVAPTPAETPATQPTPTAPVRAAPPTPEKRELDCVTRLLTAGLEVDESLSKSIPTDYHLSASTSGRLVEDGTASVDALDLSMYKSNHDIRIVCGDILVESVRVGGKVGVYYRNYATNDEAFGKAAIEKAKDRICKEGVEVSYLVIELPP